MELFGIEVMKNRQLITLEKEPDEVDLTGSEFIFFSADPVQQCISWHYAQKHSLEYFLHQVSKKPTNLICHIQRIFFCYHENISEQLYASLLDFFLVLNGNGRDISLRMYHGSKSRLSPEYRGNLSRLLTVGAGELDRPLGHRYSLLYKGLTGSCNLIFRSSEPKSTKASDPLQLAQEFIEYSQLEQARVVLEKAIKEDSDSKEIHEELLSLYQSTEDFVNFQKMYAYVKQQDNFMLKTWHDFHTSLVVVANINEA